MNEEEECCENCKYWDKTYWKCENPDQRANDADYYMSPPEHNCWLHEFIEKGKFI